MPSPHFTNPPSSPPQPVNSTFTPAGLRVELAAKAATESAQAQLSPLVENLRQEIDKLHDAHARFLAEGGDRYEIA